MKMKRDRTIAAAPIRSAADAWLVVSRLLAETLERSPDVSAGSVTTELTTLGGLGSALIAGGHLESKGLVLVDVGLHLTVFVATGDAALRVEENLNPVPGGATATNGWTLHLPPVEPFRTSIAAAVARSSHLSGAPPPPSPLQENGQGPTRKSPIDLEALQNTEKIR